MFPVENITKLIDKSRFYFRFMIECFTRGLSYE